MPAHRTSTAHRHAGSALGARSPCCRKPRRAESIGRNRRQLQRAHGFVARMVACRCGAHGADDQPRVRASCLEHPSLREIVFGRSLRQSCRKVRIGCRINPNSATGFGFATDQLRAGERTQAQIKRASGICLALRVISSIRQSKNPNDGRLRKCSSVAATISGLHEFQMSKSHRD